MNFVVGEDAEDSEDNCGDVQGSKDTVPPMSFPPMRSTGSTSDLPNGWNERRLRLRSQVFF